MLVKCKECQREISDQAHACPHCGAPTRGTAKTLVELTAKRYKAWKAAGAAVIALGILILFVGMSKAVPDNTIIPMIPGFVLTACGIVVSVIVSIVAWWHHG